MNDKELYLYHCKKLQNLLEADQNEISNSLQQDFLFEYRSLLEKEKEVLYDMIGYLNNI